MNQRQRFARSYSGRTAATVVPCRVCERRTRDTGNGDICGQCYELAGIENEISDGHCQPAERMPEVEALVEVLRKKGVDLGVWQDLIDAVHS